MVICVFQRYGLLQKALCVFALTGFACASADEHSVEQRREAPGVLKLPLWAVGESGDRYFLSGVFQVTTPDHVVVARLTTDDPETDALSVELQSGQYVVELMDGWTLERSVDGTRAPVPARLASVASLGVHISPEETSVVVFRFETARGTVPRPGGTLGIAISVDETSSCGGPAYPLRVDPEARDGGEGCSWEAPMSDLQSAIDAQAAAGGGEVWVRGGGPFASLTGTLQETLIHLRDNVSVVGGFAGTELRREERDPEGRTILLGAKDPADYADAALIEAASEATLDGFSIRRQSGPVLSVEGASAFRVVNVSITDSEAGQTSLVTVRDSVAEFDMLEIRDSLAVHAVGGLFVERSDVVVVRSAFTHVRTVGGSATALGVVNSSLVLDQVRFERNQAQAMGAGALAADRSRILATDSVWLNNSADHGALWIERSRFVAVNSHWEHNTGIGPVVSALAGTDALFLNSSFVSNSSQAFGTVYAENGALAVVSCTFFDNEMAGPFTLPQVPEDIGFAGPGQPALYNAYSNRGEDSILQPYSGAGNCLLAGGAREVRVVAGLTQILLRPEFGCTDTGDDDAARSALEEAAAFAATLGVSLPVSGEWWRDLTSVAGLSSDAGPIDPGRHYVCRDDSRH
jgi:hypothetical protein